MKNESLPVPSVGDFVRLDPTREDVGSLRDKVWELYKLGSSKGMVWIRRPVRSGKKFKKREIWVGLLKTVAPLEAVAIQATWPKKVFY